jgi:E3 ubiquitin-protein ligase MYCBP2
MGKFQQGLMGQCGQASVGFYLFCQECRQAAMSNKEPLRGSDAAVPAATDEPGEATYVAVSRIADRILFLLDVASAKGSSGEAPVATLPQSLAEHVPHGLHARLLLAMEAAPRGLAEDDLSRFDLGRSTSLAPHEASASASASPARHPDLRRQARLEQAPAPSSFAVLERMSSVDSRRSEDEPHAAPAPPPARASFGRRPARPAFSRALSMPYDQNAVLAMGAAPTAGDIAPSGPVGRAASHVPGMPSATVERQTQSALLDKPSRALRALVQDGGGDVLDEVCEFGCSDTDVDLARLLLKRQFRQAYRRFQGLAAFSQLLKCVSSIGGAQDVLWGLVASQQAAKLLPAEALSDKPDAAADADRFDQRGKRDAMPLGRHPLIGLARGGLLSAMARRAHYRLLLDILDLMRALPASVPLQAVALQAWAIPFSEEDRSFLHRSHIFSLVSKLIHESQAAAKAAEAGHKEDPNNLVSVFEAEETTKSCEISVSSREAMLDALTDGQTDTFWEADGAARAFIHAVSREEGADLSVSFCSIFIDGTRDNAQRVKRVETMVGPDKEKLQSLGKHVSLPKDFTGWLTLALENADGSHFPHARLVLQGQSSKMRVRQIRLYGNAIKADATVSTASSLRQQADDALRLFHELTLQIFGQGRSMHAAVVAAAAAAEGVGEGAADGGGGGDDAAARPGGGEGRKPAGEDAPELQQHVVGLLFTQGSKLSALQAQVCQHFFEEIKGETARASALRRPLKEGEDAYLFELLSMVAALSSSDAGMAAICKEVGLVTDLVGLLHCGSPRVQRQVVNMIRRLFKHVPPAFFSFLSQSNDGGLLALMLLAVSKALELQLRNKVAGREVSTLHMDQVVENATGSADGKHDWLVGRVTFEGAAGVVNLVTAVLEGEMGETWADYFRSGLMAHIRHLASLEDDALEPESLLRKTGTWLALGALACLDVATAQSIMQTERSLTRAKGLLCDNHDDGTTEAVATCPACEQNLCEECERVLHLNRRSKSHERTRISTGGSAIQVEQNEGCGRLKLQHLLALSDRSTMKAVIEIKKATSSSNVCRFCEGALGSDGGMTQLVTYGIKNCCSQPDCVAQAKIVCRKTHPCGHACCGVKDEEPCLPCLDADCHADSNLTQDKDDQCMICFTGSLPEEACIRVRRGGWRG